MAALDTLVVTTALTTIRADLGASIEQLEWTVNGYNLSFAVLLMTAAGLGDRLGRRRMFAVGLGLFSVASAACALAPDIGLLIAARALQGAGAALITTLAFALVSSAFAPERRGWALGIFFAVTGLAVASGPLIGGAIAEGLAWQWIFWLNVPLGLALVPLVRARVTESFGQDTALEVVGAFAGGALLLAAFVAWQLRAPEPMLPMRFFRLRAFTAGNTAIFFALGSLFGGVFFLPQFLQTSLGFSPLEAGLGLLPWTATLFFVAPVAGALVERLGERPFMVVGPLLQATGLGWLALTSHADMAYGAMIAPLIIAGAGVSMSFPA